MNEQEKAATKAWVDRWVELGPELEKLSMAHDAKLPLAQVIPQFNGALRSALAKHPPQPYSGLVELQAILQRGRSGRR